MVIFDDERPINVIVGGTDGRSLYISTFGGVYEQRVNAYGVSPNPPMTETSGQPTATSSVIDDSIEASLNIVYAEIGPRKLLMDLFQPTDGDNSPRPAVVVVHGGGWLKGDKTKFRALALRLAERPSHARLNKTTTTREVASVSVMTTVD